MNGRRKRLISSCQVAKEGKRFYAFYRGWRDARAGRHENPYPAGTESARHWASGQKYMEDDE